mmetsp:Transcript_52964/g.154290  ORF Transcript_52964/g.154290 Transcript_52964/m.154290 type:complete len:391 (-) Transcript_52964:65-1237(-)
MRRARDRGYGVGAIDDDSSEASGLGQLTPYDVDPLKALIYHRVWLSGSPGELALAEDSVDEEKRSDSEGSGDESSPGQEGAYGGSSSTAGPGVSSREEEARWAKLNRELKGHEVWLRTRDQRKDFLTPSEAEKVSQVREKIARAIAGPQRSPCKPVAAPLRHWFLVRAARDPASRFDERAAFRGSDGLHGAPETVDVGEFREAAARLDPFVQEKRTWAWRADFVNEALLAARGSGMRCCTITKYSRGTRRLKEREGYAEAVSSAGGRELWSPAFLGVLEALRVQWGLTASVGAGCVRLEERDARQRFPELKWEEEPDLLADLRPDAVHVPRGLARRLKAAGPPAPPPLPQKLPRKLFYQPDEDWCHMLSSPPQPTLRGTVSLPSLRSMLR